MSKSEQQRIQKQNNKIKQNKTKIAYFGNELIFGHNCMFMFKQKLYLLCKYYKYYLNQAIFGCTDYISIGNPRYAVYHVYQPSTSRKNLVQELMMNRDVEDIFCAKLI